MDEFGKYKNFWKKEEKEILLVEYEDEKVTDTKLKGLEREWSV